MNFLVTVIIPVFNAEKFLATAINSVLVLEEVGELILIDDGSKDSSFSIMEKFADEDNRVKIYYHENKSNRGRAFSRNVGILNATNEYIAFLDADDYYLPNRFLKDKFLFEMYSDIEGVYNNIGVHFYRESTIIEREHLAITGVSEEIEAEELFEMLLSCKKGYYSIDGLTVKKNVFNKTGLFREELKVAEDTFLFYIMALTCNFKTGEYKTIVAKRGVHEENIFNNEDEYKIYRPKMFEMLVDFMVKNKNTVIEIDILLNWMWFYRYKRDYRLMNEIFYYIKFFHKNPSLILTPLLIKYFPLIRLRKKLFPIFFR